ncbi:MAG: ATP-binding cassette domain-containing protein [Marinilabiliaceae bacterium]|nr:ATP-binding cassette domain-containing protein [Marinilabiliaceae bacterium]
MSETVLKALMQLFALVSSTEHNDETRRNIVRNYLNQHLNNKLVEEYLKLYDSYQQEQESKLKENRSLQKRFSVSSVKILKIASKINEELTYYQKLIVTIQLLEFLNSGEKGFTKMELDFVNTLAVTFNINAEEYLSIYNYVADVSIDNPDIEDINLYKITGNPQKKYLPYHIFKEHLRYELFILNISSVNLLLLKTRKNLDLTLNGQLLQPNRLYFWRPGSSLRDSRITPITYTDINKHFTKSVAKYHITFEVDNIAFKYNTGKAELHQMSFVSESGNMVGIMGDSGTGKSTLINLLTGTLPVQKGQILINGIDMNKRPEKIEGLIGYVTQDDLLMEDLTVYQNLYYNALLCFDHLTKPQIKRKVENLLKTLGLFEIRHLKVGNPLEKVISGGQRKRLNIALELIREPAVMFLDEPTSGLSSSDSENIIDLLKELTQKGKLIFVVIHQPSSQIFKMFNQLLVLDQGGYLIYDGDPVESINFFKSCVNHVDRHESECSLCGNVSPEQILTIVNTTLLDEYGNPSQTRKISSEEWHQIFKDKNIQQPEQTIEDVSPLPKINFTIPKRLKQFFIFLTRDVRAKLANRQYLLINLLESPLLAILLASIIFYFEIKPGADNYIFYQNPNIPIFTIMSVVIAFFLGLTVSAEEIISDRKIRSRESFLHLSRFSYITSKVFIMACLSAIQMAFFVIIGNSIIQIKGMMFSFWLILFSAAVNANLLGLIISDTMKKTVNIYILIPFLIIPQLILSGVFINYDQLNPRLSSPKVIPWYGEIITSRWAYEALIVHQFKENEYQKNFFVYDKLKSRATYKKDFLVPELKNRLTRFEKSTDDNEKKQILALLQNEIIKHNNRQITGLHFHKTDFLVPDKFSAAINEELSLYLDTLKQYYVSLFIRADDALEAKKKELIDENSAEWFQQLKNKHHNESLERFVKRSNDIFSNRIVQYKNELIQKFDPIYEDPTSKFLKAHFMTSSKKIGNTSINTFYVNLVILWFMNIIMFFCLYYEVLKKSFKIRDFARSKFKG